MIKLSKDPAKHSATVLKSPRYPLNPHPQNGEHPSTRPIHPERIVRLHNRVIQPQQFRMYSFLFLARTPRKHFVTKNKGSAASTRKELTQSSSRRETNSPFRRSDNFITQA